MLSTGHRIIASPADVVHNNGITVSDLYDPTRNDV